MRVRSRAYVVGTVLLLCAQLAAAVEWPQEISGDEGTLIVYQPQPETLVGNVVTGRSAFSIELKDRDEPIFGAMFFTARIDTDGDEDAALVRDFDVTRVAWPDSKDAGEQRLEKFVEAQIPEGGFEISMSRLSASLADAEVEQKSLENLKNDPPKIVFRQSLAVLLLYDGKPRFTDLPNSDYERVQNTPFVVVRNKKTKKVYLSSGKLFYESSDPLGPWMPTSSPPADLVKALPEPDDDEPVRDPPPDMVVATEPTELICTDGKPKWTSLTGGKVLFVENTETAWLRELSTGNMYILLSGRWYRASKEEGPWTFVRADELPASFEEIPPASDIGGLRVSVAGTEEAEEAVVEAAIPQTAAIKRDEAKLEVTYDGEPKFEKISGTKVSHAVNTNAQVLLIDGSYYACDNGVWFTSKSAKGPWAVADSIPDEEIQKIPPSSPVYNTTYVQVYDSTPDVVYVGYTPGYMWSYPYYGVPVYGTGYHYPPYWGGAYYPRPPTWGFHVGYNPWTGWNFGMSWSNGFMSFGVSFGGGYGCCGGGWYGGGYRGPVHIETGDINIGNNVNIGNRNKIGNKIDRRKIDRNRNNLYDRPGNRKRNASPALAKRDRARARPATGRKNNVYADRNGNVARRKGDNWERRSNDGWTRDAKPKADKARAHDKVKPAAQKAKAKAPNRGAQAKRSNTGLNHRDLDRAHRSRQTGARRERSRAASRGGSRTGGGGRMGGGRMGGGGRRR